MSIYGQFCPKLKYLKLYLINNEFEEIEKLLDKCQALDGLVFETDGDFEDDYIENDYAEDNKENTFNFNELEYRERDLALKEHELALRE